MPRSTRGIGAGRARRGRGRRGHARGRGVVLGGDAARAARRPARARCARSCPSPTPRHSAGAWGSAGPGDGGHGLRVGAAAIAPRRRPDPRRRRRRGAGRRRGRAHAHLLHGLQCAEAARSRAVPALRRHRRGMSIGEAAAFLVLEDAERARARGARPRRAAGAAMTTDAHHVTAPHPAGDGMVRAMQLALDAARRGAAASGLRQRAWHRHTPERPHRGASPSPRVRRGRRAGQLEQVAGRPHDGRGGRVEAVGDRARPRARAGSAHREPGQIDPEVPFDCVPGVARPAGVEVALSNSFGFGGQNVSLVFGRSAG